MSSPLEESLELESPMEVIPGGTSSRSGAEEEDLIMSQENQEMKEESPLPTTKDSLGN